MKKLSQLEIGRQSMITHVEDSELKPKLLEMGFVVGQHVAVLFKAPMGDPIAVEVGAYVLSMRREEANLIQISE